MIKSGGVQVKCVRGKAHLLGQGTFDVKCVVRAVSYLLMHCEVTCQRVQEEQMRGKSSKGRKSTREMYLSLQKKKRFFLGNLKGLKRGLKHF